MSKTVFIPPPIICNIHWANDVCQKRKFSDMASKWNNLSWIKWKEEEEKRCVTFSFLMNLKLSLFFKSLAFYLFFFSVGSVFAGPSRWSGATWTNQFQWPGMSKKNECLFFTLTCLLLFIEAGGEEEVGCLLLRMYFQINCYEPCLECAVAAANG